MQDHDATGANRSDWLLHIGEDVRTTIHSVLVEAAGVIDRTPPEAWTRQNLPSRVSVDRALSLEGRRRSASFHASEAMFTLVAPTYRVARRHRLEISGNSAPGDLPQPPAEAYAATLRWWLANLAEAPTPARAKEAKAFRLGVLRLTLGVIENLGIDWQWFRSWPGIDRRHTIVVQPSKPGSGTMVFSSGRKDRPATINPELATEFDRLVDRRMHVSLFLDHSPGDLPWVWIGRPPEVVMSRIERDEQPIEVLTAIASVPPGARLLG